jgi:hypothetical protein
MMGTGVSMTGTVISVLQEPSGRKPDNASGALVLLLDSVTALP